MKIIQGVVANDGRDDQDVDFVIQVCREHAAPFLPDHASRRTKKPLNAISLACHNVERIAETRTSGWHATTKTLRPFLLHHTAERTPPSHCQLPLFDQNAAFPSGFLQVADGFRKARDLDAHQLHRSSMFACSEIPGPIIHARFEMTHQRLVDPCPPHQFFPFKHYELCGFHGRFGVCGNSQNVKRNQLGPHH